MANASLVVRVSAQIAEFQKSFDDAKKTTQDFADNFEGIATRAAAVGSFFGNIAADMAKSLASGLAGAIRDAVKFSSEFSNAFIGLASVARAFGSSTDEATAAAKKLSADGLLPLKDSATGLKNLLAAGFSLPQATKLMEAFKDSAAFGRQGALSFGDAVRSATEGVKNGNSILVDNAGVTKNLSVILKEAGFTMQDLSDKTKGAAAKQALYAGILKETAAQTGDSTRLTQTYTGQLTGMTTSWTNLLATWGDAITKNATVSEGLGAVRDLFNKFNGTLSDNRRGYLLVSDAIIKFVDVLAGTIRAIDFVQSSFNTLDSAIVGVTRSILKNVKIIADGLLDLLTVAARIPGSGIVLAAMSNEIVSLAIIAGKAGPQIEALSNRIKDNDARTKSWHDTLGGAAKTLDGLADRLRETRGKTVELGQASGSAGVAIDTGLTANTKKATKELDLLHKILSKPLPLNQGMTGSIPGFSFDLKILKQSAENLNLDITLAKPIAITRQELQDLGGQFDVSMGHVIPAAVKTSQNSLDELARAFAQMAQVSGGAFGQVLQQIGSLVTALDTAKKGIGSIKAGAAAGGASGLLDMASGYLALAGAAVQAGKALRPLLGIHHGKLGDALGTNRDGRLVVEQLAEIHGGFDTLHSDLLRLGPEGEQMWIQLTQKVDNGKIEEARKAVDSVTAAFERARKGLDTAASGINSKADVFAAPFRTALADLDKLTSQFDKESLKLAKTLLKKPSANDAEAAKFGLDLKSQIFDQFKATTQVEGQIDSIIAKVSEMREKMQPEFERIGTFVAATFSGLVRENGNAIAAIEALAPAFQVLQEGVNDFGLTSTGTIDQLLTMFNLVNDSVQGPILKSIQATGQIFTGLQDAGILTSDLFQTVGEDIGESFRQLEEKGGDVAAAMALSQPVLQKLWEAQQTYGNITDETTQKILAQAEEQGLVGANMKDVNQKILDVLISIAEVFGAKLPEAFNKTKKAAKDAAGDVGESLAGIKAPDIHVRVKFDVDELPDGPDIPAMASGGIVRRPTLALIGEAGPEAVVPLSRAGLGLGTSTVGGDTYVYIGNEQLDSRVVKVTRQDAARGGLRTRTASGRTY